MQKDDQIGFKQFKLIKINDDEEVEEILSFVHHVYKRDNDMQQILISDDSKLMIEKLMNHRVLVYEWRGT
jgi:hypothetical protein